MLPLIRRARAEAHAASASASPPSSSVRSVSVPARAEAHAASASVAVPAPTPLPPLALLPGVPRVRYAAAAVSAAYGAALLAWLRSASAPPWTTLRSRRVCAVSPPAALPAPLAALAAALVAAGIFPAAAPPNHALINAYAPGEGILPHADGAAYAPRVATLSLGSPALLVFSDVGPPPAPRQEVLLEENSLVVFDGEAYERLLHSVPPRHEDVVGELAHCVNAPAGRLVARAARVSVTLRHVPDAAALQRASA